jgi:hypothetical protein
MAAKNRENAPKFEAKEIVCSRCRLLASGSVNCRFSADPMATGAAVRTFNVLLAEDRAVAASLIAVE